MTLNKKYGWVFKVANICCGDDTVGELDDIVDNVYEDDNDNSNDNDEENEDGDGDNTVEQKKDKPKILHTSLSSNWIVPLIKKVMTVKPNTSNSDLHHILSPFCRKYALTRGLLQKAQNKSRMDIFGLPEDNAKYFAACQDELQLRQNLVKTVTTDCATAITKLQMTVLADEVQQ